MDTDAEDQLIHAGKRAAYWNIINMCLQELGILGMLVTDIQLREVYWLQERDETFAKLRELCAEYGDNDWDYTSYIPDVLEKHLGRLS